MCRVQRINIAVETPFSQNANPANSTQWILMNQRSTQSKINLESPYAKMQITPLIQGKK